MPRALTLTQNSFAVLALFAIISLSVVTTLGLSPTVISKQGQVEGASTQSPTILSNFIPLEVSDLNNPAPEYTSQLVQLTQSQYKYSASFNSHDTGSLDYGLIKVVNPNSAAVKVKLSASVAKEITRSLNVSVNSGDTYRLHDSDKTDDRIVEFTIPANGSSDINVNYEILQPISFPFQVTFSIQY